jgi:hypothetical protein
MDKTKIVVLITCLVAMAYFGLGIYNQTKPKTLNEQKMECLKLGSNARADACLKLLK